MYIIITEKNRIDRLLIAKKEIEKHGVNPLTIKDHKGTLEVTWDFEPGITDKKICSKVWKQLDEYLVEHIYPKTIKEIVEL